MEKLTFEMELVETKALHNSIGLCPTKKTRTTFYWSCDLWQPEERRRRQRRAWRLHNVTVQFVKSSQHDFDILDLSRAQSPFPSDPKMVVHDLSIKSEQLITTINRVLATFKSSRTVERFSYTPDIGICTLPALVLIWCFWNIEI